MNVCFTGMYDQTMAYAPDSPNWKARVEGITRQISEEVTRSAQKARNTKLVKIPPPRIHPTGRDRFSVVV